MKNAGQKLRGKGKIENTEKKELFGPKKYGIKMLTFSMGFSSFYLLIKVTSSVLI